MKKPFFQTRLAFTLTPRCNLHCRHCLADASPAWSSNAALELDMPLRDLQRWIDEVASSQKVHTISFTGGEPFLVYDNLVDGVSRAAQRGLATTVLTNAYWASSIKRARAYLSPLQALGTLKISTDEFHQEFVPLAWVKSATQAATELGIQVRIKFCYLENQEGKLAALERQLGNLISNEQINAEPVYRLGRAIRELKADQFVKGDLDQPCAVANVPIVQPDGSVYACCGPTFDGQNPLLLGNLGRRSLPEVLDASETNVILHFLRLWGPFRLWKLLCSEYSDSLKSLKLDTTSMCSLCSGLMTNHVTKMLLVKKAQDPSLTRQTAVQRLLLLQEATMLARLNANNVLRFEGGASPII